MGIRLLVRRLIWCGLLVYGLTLAAVTWVSLSYTNPTKVPQADVIVCLGAGVDENGILDESAKARTRTCARLFSSGAAPKVLFTGGNDAPGAPGGGKVMAETANLPDTATRVEDQSRSTLQNALFSKPLLTDAKSIILVTDAFHLPRSYASFKVMGDWDQYLWASERQRPTPFWGADWQMLHREALAIWFNIARYSAWRTAKFFGQDNIDHWLI